MLRITTAVALTLLLLGTLSAGIGEARADDQSALERGVPARASLPLDSTSAVAVAADPQAFRPYTGLSALQLAGTMVVNPSRLETIEVVGAFALDRVAHEIGDEAIEAAIEDGQAKIAFRYGNGELISVDVGQAGLNIDALTRFGNAYLLAKTPDLLPSKPDFRAIDWNAPRSAQPEG